MSIFATRALLADGWQTDVRLEIAQGRVHHVATGAAPRPGDTRVDTLLPALANLHSHAFQRAMAGMTEIRGGDAQDSFWTWRALMYRFIARLTPEQIEAIAAQAYLEMLEAGFAAVGEFHYLHHQPGGAAYADRAETSARIMAAAGQSGIGLTLLPVLYSYGGAGRQPLTGGQLRFGNSVEGFAALVEAARRAASALPEDTRIGIAPHSLRATAPVDLAELTALFPDALTHIHIAEQPAEIADITAWLGAPPVAWALDNLPVGPRWCLVHATHMTADETARLARSGAVAGLCPLTEADLGDGPFDGPAYLAAGGAFGIGSDSNLRISPAEELRMLEYSQRLRDLGRNILAGSGGSTGTRLYLGAAAGGAQALGRAAGTIAPGNLADLVAIDTTAPALCALSPAQLLDGWIFAAGNGVVREVWAAGRHMVQGGRHIRRAAITGQFRQCMADLMQAI